jgi:BirA family transcriptional regulator, biotin operon repressor / biotin---[acetyl-CoA-carboxylase] ligase
MEPLGDKFKLARAAVDLGYRLEAVDEIGSTNDLALARARAGECLGNLWVVARRQTLGRGRQGRLWVSLPGNLHASLMLIDPCSPAKAPELGFMTGLALYEAASSLTELRYPRLALKWPNDLLIDGAKCAGILLEGHRLANGALVVIIGVGANVAVSPPDAPNPVANMRAHAPRATAQHLLALLSDAFARRREDWVRSASDSDRLFAAWEACAHGLGSRVSVRSSQGEVMGLFRGLDRGRLVVETTAGPRKLDAGDLQVISVQDAADLAPT